MADLELKDVVLLSSHFRMWPDPPRATAAVDTTPFAYPEGDFLSLATATKRDDRGVVLYLHADIDDFAIPFTLSVLVAGRFEGADAEVAPDDRENMVRLCFPFLRDVVATLTGRSPMPTYYLPPRRAARYSDRRV